LKYVPGARNQSRQDFCWTTEEIVNQEYGFSRERRCKEEQFPVTYLFWQLFHFE
jgi:hypothetical protein